MTRFTQTSAAFHPGKLRVWLQLFRAPNLFTVPGDPLSGYLLAVRGSIDTGVFLAMAASLCFYAGGLLMNDLADFSEDLRERPSRPLPSGTAGKRQVQLAAVLLMLAGLGFCMWRSEAFFVGLLLSGMIATYNFWSKRIALIGAINMGACRGLSLLLGATIAGFVTTPVIAAAILLTLYVAAITNLSRSETKATVPFFAKILPLLTVLGGAIAFPIREPHVNAHTFYAFYAVAIVACASVTARTLRNAQTPLPPIIGALIRVLLLVQAAFCAGSNTGWFGGAPALVLLALVPISRLVGRRFYAS